MFVPWNGHGQVMSAVLKKFCQILQLPNSSQTISQKNLLLINATVFRMWEILRPQIATCWHLCLLLRWAFPALELTRCRKLMFHTLLCYVCLCLNGIYVGLHACHPGIRVCKSAQNRWVRVFLGRV